MAEADVLFREATALMKAGRAAEACPKFAKSQRLDPASATLFRLAECHEQFGRYAKAAAIYEETVMIAKAASRKDREELSKARLEAIRPKIPWVSLKLTPDMARLPDLRLILDGDHESPIAFPKAIDSGSHTLEVSAPGFGPWSRTFSAMEGQRVEIVVPPLSSAGEERAVEPERKLAPAGPSTAVLVTGAGLSVLMLGTGVGLTLASQGNAREAEIQRAQLLPLGERACLSGALRACDRLLSLYSLSDTLHDFSVAAYVSAGVFSAATLGYLLWAKKPAAGPRPSVAPVLGSGFGGVTLTGSF